MVSEESERKLNIITYLSLIALHHRMTFRLNVWKSLNRCLMGTFYLSSWSVDPRNAGQNLSQDFGSTNLQSFELSSAGTETVPLVLFSCPLVSPLLSLLLIQHGYMLHFVASFLIEHAGSGTNCKHSFQKFARAGSVQRLSL